jgi:hypothetical protein
MIAGTSACSNGRFFCQNIGHEPKLINASFVDDSVCGACISFFLSSFCSDYLYNENN